VDGRSRQDYRQGDLTMDAVTNCHGSVRVRLGETDLIVASKVDLGAPEEGRPAQGTINFLVDWLVLPKLSISLANQTLNIFD